MNGGQSGFVVGQSKQTLSLSTAANPAIETIGEIGGVPNPVNRAALWLHQHRSDLVGSAIPVLRKLFDLSNLEAIEAMKQAHALAYSGA
ncbi:hypothetical protein ASE23_15765 [Rhizobium sp. Root73]|nr:hypothetical protein ASD36_06205 [Rhizobium sp. Root1334]KRB98474.1 hypothetical protein ASE23_15765 [Rhizobium sp. Root73]